MSSANSEHWSMVTTCVGFRGSQVGYISAGNLILWLAQPPGVMLWPGRYQTPIRSGIEPVGETTDECNQSRVSRRISSQTLSCGQLHWSLKALRYDCVATAWSSAFKSGLRLHHFPILRAPAWWTLRPRDQRAPPYCNRLWLLLSSAFTACTNSSSKFPL